MDPSTMDSCVTITISGVDPSSEHAFNSSLVNRGVYDNLTETQIPYLTTTTQSGVIFSLDTILSIFGPNIFNLLFYQLYGIYNNHIFAPTYHTIPSASTPLLGASSRFSNRTLQGCFILTTGSNFTRYLKNPSHSVSTTTSLVGNIGVNGSNPSFNNINSSPSHQTFQQQSPLSTLPHSLNSHSSQSSQIPHHDHLLGSNGHHSTAPFSQFFPQCIPMTEISIHPTSTTTFETTHQSLSQHHPQSPYSNTNIYNNNNNHMNNFNPYSNDTTLPKPAVIVSILDLSTIVPDNKSAITNFIHSTANTWYSGWPSSTSVELTHMARLRNYLIVVNHHRMKLLKEMEQYNTEQQNINIKNNSSSKESRIVNNNNNNNNITEEIYQSPSPTRPQQQHSSYHHPSITPPLIPTQQHHLPLNFDLALYTDPGPLYSHSTALSYFLPRDQFSSHSLLPHSTPPTSLNPTKLTQNELLSAYNMTSITQDKSSLSNQHLVPGFTLALLYTPYHTIEPTNNPFPSSSSIPTNPFIISTPTPQIKQYVHPSMTPVFKRLLPTYTLSSGYSTVSSTLFSQSFTHGTINSIFTPPRPTTSQYGLGLNPASQYSGVVGSGNHGSLLQQLQAQAPLLHLYNIDNRILPGSEGGLVLTPIPLHEAFNPHQPYSLYAPGWNINGHNFNSNSSNSTSNQPSNSHPSPNLYPIGLILPPVWSIEGNISQNYQDNTHLLTLGHYHDEFNSQSPTNSFNSPQTSLPPKSPPSFKMPNTYNNHNINGSSWNIPNRGQNNENGGIFSPPSSTQPKNFTLTHNPPSSSANVPLKGPFTAPNGLQYPGEYSRPVHQMNTGGHIDRGNNVGNENEQYIHQNHHQSSQNQQHQELSQLTSQTKQTKSPSRRMARLVRSISNKNVNRNVIHHDQVYYNAASSNNSSQHQQPPQSLQYTQQKQYHPQQPQLPQQSRQPSTISLQSQQYQRQSPNQHANPAANSGVVGGGLVQKPIIPLYSWFSNLPSFMGHLNLMITLSDSFNVLTYAFQSLLTTPSTPSLSGITMGNSPQWSKDTQYNFIFSNLPQFIPFSLLGTSQKQLFHTYITPPPAPYPVYTQLPPQLPGSLVKNAATRFAKEAIHNKLNSINNNNIVVGLKNTISNNNIINSTNNNIGRSESFDQIIDISNAENDDHSSFSSSKEDNEKLSKNNDGNEQFSRNEGNEKYSKNECSLPTRNETLSALSKNVNPTACNNINSIPLVVSLDIDVGGVLTQGNANNGTYTSRPVPSTPNTAPIDGQNQFQITPLKISSSTSGHSNFQNNILGMDKGAQSVNNNDGNSKHPQFHPNSTQMRRIPTATQPQNYLWSIECDTSWGTGIHLYDGYILTCAHVLIPRQTYHVRSTKNKTFFDYLNWYFPQSTLMNRVSIPKSILGQRGVGGKGENGTECDCEMSISPSKPPSLLPRHVPHHHHQQQIAPETSAANHGIPGNQQCDELHLFKKLQGLNSVQFGDHISSYFHQHITNCVLPPPKSQQPMVSAPLLRSGSQKVGVNSVNKGRNDDLAFQHSVHLANISGINSVHHPPLVTEPTTNSIKSQYMEGSFDNPSQSINPTILSKSVQGVPLINSVLVPKVPKPSPLELFYPVYASLQQSLYVGDETVDFQQQQHSVITSTSSTSSTSPRQNNLDSKNLYHQKLHHNLQPQHVAILCEVVHANLSLASPYLRFPGGKGQYRNIDGGYWDNHTEGGEGGYDDDSDAEHDNRDDDEINKHQNSTSHDHSKQPHLDENQFPPLPDPYSVKPPTNMPIDYAIIRLPYQYRNFPCFFDALVQSSPFPSPIKNPLPSFDFASNTVSSTTNQQIDLLNDPGLDMKGLVKAEMNKKELEKDDKVKKGLKLEQNSYLLFLFYSYLLNPSAFVNHQSSGNVFVYNGTKQNAVANIFNQSNTSSNSSHNNNTNFSNHSHAISPAPIPSSNQSPYQPDQKMTPTKSTFPYPLHPVTAAGFGLVFPSHSTLAFVNTGIIAKAIPLPSRTAHIPVQNHHTVQEVMELVRFYHPDLVETNGAVIGIAIDRSVVMNQDFGLSHPPNNKNTTNKHNNQLTNQHHNEGLHQYNNQQIFPNDSLPLFKPSSTYSSFLSHILTSFIPNLYSLSSKIPNYTPPQTTLPGVLHTDSVVYQGASGGGLFLKSNSNVQLLIGLLVCNTSYRSNINYNTRPSQIYPMPSNGSSIAQYNTLQSNYNSIHNHPVHSSNHIFSSHVNNNNNNNNVQTGFNRINRNQVLSNNANNLNIELHNNPDVPLHSFHIESADPIIDIDLDQNDGDSDRNNFNGQQSGPNNDKNGQNVNNNSKRSSKSSSRTNNSTSRAALQHRIHNENEFPSVVNVESNGLVVHEAGKIFVFDSNDKKKNTKLFEKLTKNVNKINILQSTSNTPLDKPFHKQIYAQQKENQSRINDEKFWGEWNKAQSIKKAKEKADQDQLLLQKEQMEKIIEIHTDHHLSSHNTNDPIKSRHIETKIPNVFEQTAQIQSRLQLNGGNGVKPLSPLAPSTQPLDSYQPSRLQLSQPRQVVDDVIDSQLSPDLTMVEISTDDKVTTSSQKTPSPPSQESFLSRFAFKWPWGGSTLASTPKSLSEGNVSPGLVDGLPQQLDQNDKRNRHQKNNRNNNNNNNNNTSQTNKSSPPRLFPMNSNDPLVGRKIMEPSGAIESLKALYNSDPNMVKVPNISPDLFTSVPPSQYLSNQSNTYECTSPHHRHTPSHTTWVPNTSFALPLHFFLPVMLFIFEVPFPLTEKIEVPITSFVGSNINQVAQIEKANIGVDELDGLSQTKDPTPPQQYHTITQPSYLLNMLYLYHPLFRAPMVDVPDGNENCNPIDRTIKAQRQNPKQQSDIPSLSATNVPKRQQNTTPSQSTSDDVSHYLWLALLQIPDHFLSKVLTFDDELQHPWMAQLQHDNIHKTLNHVYHNKSPNVALNETDSNSPESYFQERFIHPYTPKKTTQRLARNYQNVFKNELGVGGDESDDCIDVLSSGLTHGDKDNKISSHKE